MEALFGSGGGGSARSLLAAAASNGTAAETPLGGPSSPVLDVIFCLAPVAFLLVVTLSQKLFMPTARSLPYAAVMMWVVKMCWIGEDPIHITATIMQGALLALTPLAILFSAFVFFNALQVTQTMPYIAAVVRATCCGHPVAEVMLVLWSLGHLIEGASGFGTGPATLTPIMAALGHPPFESLVCLLIMTTCVGPFGSSGIGIWFGLSTLDWTRAQLVRATFLVAACMAIMSFPICYMAARFVVTFEDLRGCWRFVTLSIASCALPALLASLFSFEAPGLLSGVLGVALTGVMAYKQLGLSQDVPCVAARRLKELEGGQAAALPEPAAEAGTAADRSLPHRPVDGAAGKEQAAASGRPVIELTAVSASSPAAQWGHQQQWQQQQRQAEGQVEHAQQQVGGDAAQGLLAALAASSPAKAGTQWEHPRPDSTLSAPAALEASELAELAGEDEDGSGDEALLPSRAVRSHHNIGAYAGGRAALGGPLDRPAATSAGPAQDSSSGGSGGSSSGAAGDADYLSDRKELARRLAPWGAMLVVVAGTRVPYLQRSNGHELRLHLRSLGDFYLSSNLVLQFKDLCRIGVNWSFPALYTPALLPFICVAAATLWAFRASIPSDKSWRDPFAAAAAKCRSVAPAIVGALILVAQMVQGGRQAPSFIIGYWLSEWLKHGYIAVSMLLGAAGSFFSGSVATSNMTFGLLQQVAAKKLGLNATAMVMLQIVGGAAGQMISISNILGGRAVMGLQHIPEGQFVRAALPACLAYYIAGTALALPFLFAG